MQHYKIPSVTLRLDITSVTLLQIVFSITSCVMMSSMLHQDVITLHHIMTSLTLCYDVMSVTLSQLFLLH